MLAVEVWDTGALQKKTVSNCGKKVEADSTYGETQPDPLVNPFLKKVVFQRLTRRCPEEGKSCSPCSFVYLLLFFSFVAMRWREGSGLGVKSCDSLVFCLLGSP